MDRFLSHFENRFIGVTGSANDDPMLKDMMKKFKIYASKIEYQDNEDSPLNYTIDHTVLSYLMD
jgi:protein SCO1/2